MKFHTTPDRKVMGCHHDAATCPIAVSSQHFDNPVDAINSVFLQVAQQASYPTPPIPDDENEDLSMFEPF